MIINDWEKRDNAARAHRETTGRCSVGQGNPFGEGGAPGKGLGKTRGEKGMPPDRRRAGGGKIQARILVHSGNRTDCAGQRHATPGMAGAGNCPRRRGGLLRAPAGLFITRVA